MNKNTRRYPLDDAEYPAKIVFTLIENPALQVGSKQTGNPDQIVQVSPPRITNEQCILYLPAGLEYNDAANYNRASLGVSGAIAEDSLRRTGDLIAAGKAAAADLGNVMKRSAEGLVSVMQGNGVGPELAKLIVTRYAGDATEGFKAGVKSTSRISTNPNYRTLFSDVPIREFQFGFKLIPTSKEEAQEIKDIIEFFRTELYPTRRMLTETVSAGYNFPNTFRIRTYYGSEGGESNLIGHKFLPCYLTAITTRYNNESMAFVQDIVEGQNELPDFSDFEINMTFTEVRALHKGDIAKGY